MAISKRRDTVTCVVLSAVILLFYTLFLIFSANGFNRHSCWYNGITSEINRDYSYEQAIYSNHDNLESISVMFATYDRENSGTVYLELFDDSGLLIDSWEYDVSDLVNTTEYSLTLDSPLADSREKTYTLKISSDSAPGEGIALYTAFDAVNYNLDYDNSSVLLTIVSLCPFILVPFVFYKLRGNTWGTAYALYCIFIIAMHLYMPLNTRDDAFFSQANNGYTLLSWITYRWNAWTSRFLQEMAGFIVVDRPAIWLFVDTAMVSLLPVYINRTLGAEGFARLYVLAAIPLYPILDMNSAGWMCTTWTYIWAVFPAFVVTSILRKVMDSKKLNWYDYPVFFFCLIFAGNHELMAVYLLCIILFCLAVAYIRKSPSPLFLIVSALVSIGTLVLFVICPGAKLRGEAEVYHFQGYENLSVPDKLFLGINRTLDACISRSEHAVFTVMCILITVAVFILTKDVRKRLIALFPTVMVLGLNSIMTVKLTDSYIWFSLRSVRVVGLVLFAVLLLISLIYSILIIYREGEGAKLLSYRGVLVCIVLAVGLATTVAMGFSPTVYVSGFRTSCFTYFGMIYVTLDVALRLTDKLKPSPKSVVPAVIACEVVFLIGRLLSVMDIVFVE